MSGLNSPVVYHLPPNVAHALLDAWLLALDEVLYTVCPRRRLQPRRQSRRACQPQQASARRLPVQRLRLAPMATSRSTTARSQKSRRRALARGAPMARRRPHMPPGPTLAPAPAAVWGG